MEVNYMDIRVNLSMVFHLDKCIGCHTCSISCKNLWTDRKGTEYMWWNNVETKPGTGYPTLWEDQEKYRGGWEVKSGNLCLKLQGKLSTLLNIFFNPYLPTIDDYYEPWTYKYDDLFNAPEGEDQPTAKPISMISGKEISIEAGPNWDDDLGGSPLYAKNDINLKSLTETEKQQLFQLERLVYFYLPRICNHCLNPGCVAACPARAIYKRGEDGIVLVSQEKCRGWRMCISGCPYKKVYYNWQTGKAEKCILCYPRQETGQAPACFHSCVGRIRYLGILLYDAEMIEEVAKSDNMNLVSKIREIIKDPKDPQVISSAKANGISDLVLEYAINSPVYKFLKVFKIALPLHPEFRTVPMLFYVPPLLPVLSTKKDDSSDLSKEFFTTISSLRIPVKYLSTIFSAGNEQEIIDIYKKLVAVRLLKRAQSVKDITGEEIERALKSAQMKEEEAEEIYKLTSIPKFTDRFVIPPFIREQAIENIYNDTYERKTQAGFGFIKDGKRRW